MYATGVLAFVAHLASAVLAAVPAPPAAQPAELLVLVLDLEAVNVDADTARAIDRLLVAALGDLEGLQVTSQEDLRKLANLDAAKQAMDCAAQSCLAEMAGALGARAVVFGSVTGLGSTTSIALSLFDSKNGVIQRRTIEAKKLDDIPAELRPTLRAIFVDAGMLAPPAEAGGLSPMVLAGAGTASVGALALLGGLVTTTVCELQLQDASMPGPAKEPLQQIGRVGLVVAGVGTVVGAIGAVLLLLPEGA